MTRPAPRRSTDLAFASAAVALALVFVGAHVLRSVEPLGLDQGLFACFTRWVPRGLLPYRDLFDSKPPLFLYSYALARLFPTDLVHSVWCLEALWQAATLALAFAAGRKIAGRWVGLAAAALLFVGQWAPGFGGYWSRAQADEFVALPLVGAAWAAWAALDGTRPRAAFWAGVLTGVAGLFKIPSMAVAAAWPLGWMLARGLRPSLRSIALLAAGVIVPWALAAAWFAAHGALGDFWSGAFVYHRYNAEFIAPPWPSVLANFALQLVGGAPLVVGAAIGGVAVLWRRRAREAYWLAPWIASTLLAVVLERQLAGYHFLLAMPALAMASAFGLVELARALSRSGRARLAAAAPLVAGLALAGLTVVRFVSAYGVDALALTGRVSRDEYLRRLQPIGFSSATEEQAARWLRERTAPTDGVLVWGLAPGIYALADRHPVTRYPFHKLLMTDAPLSRLIPGLEERRADFLRRLAADPPAYILVGHRDSNGFEPEDSFRSMTRFGGLRELLQRDYRPETEIGNFVVFRRQPPP